MNNLIEAKNTIEFLKEHGISAKKRYGQNFLIDRRILDRIIAGSEITKDDTVLEIGPGIGTMTQALCEAAGRVIAVEIDKDMIPILEENLSDYDNYSIINEDVLKLDLNKVMGEEKKRIKVAANLPYYITTPIITTLLEARPRVKNMVFMVQYEVAERICADRGRDAGAISLFCRYFAEPEIIEKVPAASFYPPPKVDSALLLLKMRKKPPVEVEDEAMLFKIIRASFAQRRKTLANALSGGLGMEKETLFGIFDSLGIDRNIRGEKLSLSDFADICNALCGTVSEN